MRAREPSRAAIDAARLLYETSPVPLTRIAAQLKLSPDALKRRCARWNWPERPPASARRRNTNAVAADAPSAQSEASSQSAVLPQPAATDALSPTMPAQPALADEPPDLATLAQRLDVTMRRMIDRTEANLASGQGDLDNGGRVLATMVKAVGELARLKGAFGKVHDGTGNADDAAPRDLAELRADLARKLAALRDDTDA